MNNKTKIIQLSSVSQDDYAILKSASEFDKRSLASFCLKAALDRASELKSSSA